MLGWMEFSDLAFRGHAPYPWDWETGPALGAALAFATVSSLHFAVPPISPLGATGAGLGPPSVAELRDGPMARMGRLARAPSRAPCRPQSARQGFPAPVC